MLFPQWQPHVLWPQRWQNSPVGDYNRIPNSHYVHRWHSNNERSVLKLFIPHQCDDLSTSYLLYLQEQSHFFFMRVLPETIQSTMSTTLQMATSWLPVVIGVSLFGMQLLFTCCKPYLHILGLLSSIACPIFSIVGLLSSQFFCIVASLTTVSIL